MQLSNGIIFLNRQPNEYNTEELVKEIEEYANQHTAPDAIILEQNQLKGMFRSTLWYGFHGTNVKLFFNEWEDKYRELSKNQPKNSITKQYEPTGNMITMSKSYGQYEFSDEELDKLYAGGSIIIDFTSQYGNTKKISGKLDKKDWPEKEITFWTFVTKDLQENEDNMITGIYQGEKIKFKNQFADHKLTKDEIKKLLDGKAIYAIITNKNGNRVSVRIKLVNIDRNFYKLRGQFEDIPYCKFSGRELTPDEIEQLHLGRVVKLDNLIAKSGKIYSTEVRWKDGKYQTKKKDGFNNSMYDGFGNGDADSF